MTNTKDPQFNPGMNAAIVLASCSTWPYPWPEPEPLAAIAAAQAELSALCRSVKRFEMHVPVDPEDTDVVIGEALRIGKRALMRVKELEAELAVVKAEGQKDYDDMRKFQSKYIELDILVRGMNNQDDEGMATHERGDE
jgi:hypothetical protein